MWAATGQNAVANMRSRVYHQQRQRLIHQRKSIANLWFEISLTWSYRQSRGLSATGRAPYAQHHCRRSTKLRAQRERERVREREREREREHLHCSRYTCHDAAALGGTNSVTRKGLAGAAGMRQCKEQRTMAHKRMHSCKSRQSRSVQLRRSI